MGDDRLYYNHRLTEREDVDAYEQGHGQCSPFAGFDMLAEPEPRWPAWLDRWYRQPWEPPKASSLDTFNAAMREAFRRPILDELRRADSLIGWMTDNRAAKERDRRRALREAQRALR